MTRNIENWIQNKTGRISLVLALMSLTSDFLTIYGEYSKPVVWFSNIFQIVNLNFMNVSFFELIGGTFSGESTYNGNGLNLTFNFIFLIASIIYLYSKKTEKHLLQFVYAIIHFYVLISLLLFVFAQFAQFTLLDPISLGFFIRDLLLLFFSYHVLKITDKELRLLIKTNKLNEDEHHDYIKASKYKRFLHLIIDTFLFISLTYRMFKILPRDFLNSIVKLLGDRYTFTLFFIITSVIYYTFFELIFNRTPAKYLTQTFVLSTKNVAVKFEDIIVKSFSRKIPFNTFSFIGDTGWHDSISKTTVLSLNTAKKNHKYLFLLPAIALFLFLNYEFNEFREDYVRYKKENGIIIGEVRAVKNKLENIEINDIISLKLTSEYYYDASHFLKVLKINGDSITLAKIKKNYEQKTLEDIDLYHEYNPSDFEVINVSKDYITKGICNTYSFFKGYKNCGFKYFEDEENMRVYSIDNPFEPVVYFDYMYRNSSNRITVEFNSHGINCQLNDVEILEGNIELNLTLPMKTKFNDDFKLSIIFKEKIGSFKLLLVFKDELNQLIDYKYIFESDGGFKNTLMKVYK